MKTFDRAAAQGDLMIVAVDEIPTSAVAVEPPTDGRLILAHSETGHHHWCDARVATLFRVENDPFTCYLSVQEVTPLTHERPWDTHEPIELRPRKYMLRRQREHTPWGDRMVLD